MSDMHYSFDPNDSITVPDGDHQFIDGHAACAHTAYLMLGGVDSDGNPQQARVTKDGLIACAMPAGLRAELEALRDEWIDDVEPGHIFGCSLQAIIERYW